MSHAQGIASGENGLATRTEAHGPALSTEVGSNAAAVPAAAQKAPSTSPVSMATEASIRRNLTAGCLFVLQGLPGGGQQGLGRAPEVTTVDVCTAIGLAGTAPVQHNAEQRLQSSLGSSSPYNSVFSFSTVLSSPSVCGVPMVFDQEGQDADEDDKVNLRVPPEWEDECHDWYGYPRPEPSEAEAVREPPRSVVSSQQQRACYDVLFDLVENHFALIRATAQLLQALLMHAPKSGSAGEGASSTSLSSSGMGVGVGGTPGAAAAPRAGKQAVWEALKGGKIFAHQSLVHAHCLLAQLKHESLVGTGSLQAGRAVAAAKEELLLMANSGGELPSTATAAFLRAFSADTVGHAQAVAGKKRTRSDVAEEEKAGGEGGGVSGDSLTPHTFSRAYPILGPDLLFKPSTATASSTAAAVATAVGLSSPAPAPWTPAQLSFAAWAAVGATPSTAVTGGTPPACTNGAGSAPAHVYAPAPPSAPPSVSGTPASSSIPATTSSSGTGSMPGGPPWMTPPQLALLAASPSKELTRVALAVHRVRVLSAIVCQYVERWEAVKSTVAWCTDSCRALQSAADKAYGQEDSACTGATQRRDAASEAKEALDTVMRGHALRALAVEYGFEPDDVIAFNVHTKVKGWSREEASSALSSASTGAHRQLFVKSFDDMFSESKLHSKFLDLLPSEQAAPVPVPTGGGAQGAGVEETAALLAAVMDGKGDGLSLTQLWRLRKAQQDLITEASAQVAIHGAHATAAKAVAEYSDHCIAYAALARLRARASLQRGLLQALSVLDSAAMELLAALITKACKDEALKLHVKHDLERTEAALREHVAVYGESAPGLRASLQQQLGEVGARLRQGQEGAVAVTEWLRCLAQDSFRLLPLEARQGLIGRFVRFSYGADAAHAITDLRSLVATEPPAHLPHFGPDSLFDPDALFAKLQRSRKAAEGMSTTTATASSGSRTGKKLSPYHNPAIHHLSINAVIPGLKMGELVSTLASCVELFRVTSSTTTESGLTHTSTGYTLTSVPGLSAATSPEQAVQALLAQGLRSLQDRCSLLLPSLSHGLPGGCRTSLSLYDTTGLLGPAELPPAQAVCRQAVEDGGQQENEEEGVDTGGGTSRGGAGAAPSAPHASPTGAVIDLDHAGQGVGVVEVLDSEEGEGGSQEEEEIDVMALAAGKERQLRALPQAMAVGLGSSVHAGSRTPAVGGTGTGGRGHGQHRTRGRMPGSGNDDDDDDGEGEKEGRGKRVRRDGYTGRVHEEEEEEEEEEEDEPMEGEGEEDGSAANGGSSGCMLM